MYTYVENNPLLYQDPSAHLVFLAPLAIYAAKVIVKTAIDVAIDYGTAKATGQTFNLGKSVVSNGAWNLVPGGGALNSARKAVKTAGVVQSTVKSTSKGKVATTGPYSHLKDPKTVGEGKDFTAAQKKIIEENRKRNNGDVRSDQSGKLAVKPAKSEKGVTPSQNEWQIDHIIAKDKGGTNSYKNAQVLTRKENRIKSNK